MVGMGKSGFSALRLLNQGFARPPENLKSYDESAGANGDFAVPEQILKFSPDFLVLSPGYPRSTPWLKDFLQTKGEGSVLTELDLAHEAMRTAAGSREMVIGITGSAGKSTVSALVAGALEAAGHKTFLGGNFGVPYCDYAFNVLVQKTPRAEFVVLELSSYQLETLKMNVDVGSITSFSKNHLDRYLSIDDYYATKARLLEKTNKVFVVNPDSHDLKTWFVSKNQHQHSKVSWAKHRAWSGQKLIGKHNEQNLNLAADILEALGASAVAYEYLLNFKGLPHRLENCGFHNGVLFVNDSKATTIDSVMLAIEALKTTCMGRLHVLVGGKDKDLPWHELNKVKNYNNVRVWFFGSVGKLAKEKSKLEGVIVNSLEEFFSSHYSQVKAGDCVLLSPGGSSLDQYKNFEERGSDFKSLVTRYIINS